jgi:hypothetical protein
MDSMLWSVASQFSFTETELWAMPLSRLRYWYRGNRAMWAQSGE